MSIEPYLAEIGWKVDWQEVVALPSADPIFVDNTKPNRNLNKNTSNYSNKQGYDIYVAFDAKVRQSDVVTNYRAISPACKINNFDEPSVDPRDWEAVISIHDIDTDADLSGFIPSDRQVKFRCTWTLVSGDINDYQNAWAKHYLEPEGQRGYGIFEYGSLRTNSLNTPLTSPSGFTTVTYNGNVITTECLIDGSLLQEGVRYTPSARLGLPNALFNEPQAQITNIVALDSGIVNWNLILTSGFGSFDPADTLELNIYDNVTNVLLGTLNGNFGDDITDFIDTFGDFAQYLGGTIAAPSNLTFNKLQWATDENLLNEDAIALRFEMTITQDSTGLTSNIATGVFAVELQDAEYAGDLRYFDNDGRKLYTSNADGSNTSAIALDLTLKYSETLFTPVAGVNMSSLRVIEDSTFGSPYSKLLNSEINQAASPYQWLIEMDTVNGVNWTDSLLTSGILANNQILNFPQKDDIRTANGKPVYWVGADLTKTRVLYMVYFDGVVWQAIDFTSKVSALLISLQTRVNASIVFDGDVYGYACKNGIGGEKRVFRMQQTGGTKTTVGDFTDLANWSVASVMAGSVASGTSDDNGASAEFANIYGMVTIADDGTRPTEIWLSDGDNYSIRKLVYNAGLDNYDVTTVVGLTGTSGDVNDIGTNARLGDVRGITKASNSVFIGDLGNNKIKEINTSSLQVTTFSGTGDAAFRLASLY